MARSHPNQPFEQHHAVDAKTPMVSVSQMLAAGLASAGAAAATSRFGVAGTLVGAALTTMIITGGSAVIRSYLETIGGRIKTAPEKLRANRMRDQAGRTAEPPPDAPTGSVETHGERRGPLGKFRSAFEWFKGLPASAKTSILLKAAIPMVLVFVIAVVAVTGAELLGGRTLSCMVWGECYGYVAADGSGSSTSFGTIASGGGGQPIQPGVEQPGVAPGGGSGGGDSGGGLFDFGGDNAADEQYSQ